MFMPLIIKNIESYTVFLTNLCLVSVFSAVRFCPHDVNMYRAHPGAQRQTAPSPDSTFAIQTYCCFSFIEYVDEIKVFFGTITIFHFAYGPLHMVLRNFIENKAFLPWNIYNKTETAVGLYCRRAPGCAPYMIRSCGQNRINRIILASLGPTTTA